MATSKKQALNVTSKLNVFIVYWLLYCQFKIDYALCLFETMLVNMRILTFNTQGFSKELLLVKNYFRISYRSKIPREKTYKATTSNELVLDDCETKKYKQTKYTYISRHSNYLGIFFSISSLKTHNRVIQRVHE